MDYQKHVWKAQQFGFIIFPIKMHIWYHLVIYIYIYHIAMYRQGDPSRRDAQSSGNTLQAALERLQLLDKEEFLGAVNLVFGLVFFAISSQEASAVVILFFFRLSFSSLFFTYYICLFCLLCFFSLKLFVKFRS